MTTVSTDMRQRYEAALERLIAQVKQDATILAAVLLGSLSHDVVWEKSDIDLVLVMSVNPGFGGQRFIASQLDKIAAVRRRIDQAGGNRPLPIDLQVDGGINHETAKLVLDAGADRVSVCSVRKRSQCGGRGRDVV